MQKNIGTLGCLSSPEFYGQCLNISQGRRSDADRQNLAITLAMGTYWFGNSRIEGSLSKKLPFLIFFQ